VRKFILSFKRDESGATAIEYGLIVGLIFLVVVSAMTSFAGKMSTMYDLISTTIGGATH
jgi:pilus assembly protein Flp/PilA